MRAKQGYHHGDLRAALLAAAARQLEGAGVEGLSLRDVAKQAGVSHAAPYRHFRDKRALLEALAAEGFSALERSIEVATGRHPDDPAEAFVQVGEAYIRHAVENPHRTRLMFGGLLNHDDLAPSLHEVVVSSFQALVGVVRRVEGAGWMKGAPTRENVLAVWSAAHGLAMLAIGGQVDYVMPGVALRDQWRALAARLLAGGGSAP